MTTPHHHDVHEEEPYDNPHKHEEHEAQPLSVRPASPRVRRFSSRDPLRPLLLPGSIVLAALLASGAWVYTTKLKYGGAAPSKVTNTTTSAASSTETASSADTAALSKDVFPANGVKLDIDWNNIGKTLVDNGTIDRSKLEAIYANRGDLQKDDTALLDGTAKGDLVMTEKNAPFLLNLFWAVGLANTNEILEKGPMSDPQYGGAGGFASTGGWTLAKDDAMSHFSKYAMVKLTAAEQERVVNVSKNIYRPCCGNSVYFPDCNHGMAMLGLLEMMAANGASEDAMYRTALTVNSYWFPDTYLTIAKYMKSQGKNWKSVDPKEVLGAAYSSANGYKKIAAQVNPVQSGGGSGCGV